MKKSNDKSSGKIYQFVSLS